jgi:toxin ParE1/3/4
MPTAVAVTRRAQLQLGLIVDYLIQRNPAAARRFQERIGAACRQLAALPFSGPPASRPGTRRLVVAPYVLTYRVTSAAVEILDVRHSRQRETPLPDDC